MAERERERSSEVDQEEERGGERRREEVAGSPAEGHLLPHPADAEQTDGLCGRPVLRMRVARPQRSYDT